MSLAGKLTARGVSGSRVTRQWTPFLFALIVLTAAIATLVSISAAASEDVDARAGDLLRRMTLEEKLGQMSQSTSMASPVSEAIKNQIRRGRWGSFLNAGSPADRAEAQRIAIHESRLGIPLIFARDVIHGYRTIFPIPLGQAASWDPDLVEKSARIAALEASSEGIRWTFAPMLDITRDPRWGRVAEGLGEDPYLTGALGAAMVRGFQGKSLVDGDSLAATAKHFAGYGASEAGREYNSTWIPEGLLRDVYLPPFHAAANASAATFMAGFNSLNGVPATGNTFLLRNILRDEWKFKGVVVSDYTAIPEMIQHGYAANEGDAARKALSAGVDMEMVSTTYFGNLKHLMETHQIAMSEIDEAVRRILVLKFRLGLFDQKPSPPVETQISQAARTAAGQLARESVVLLKNEGTLLPLKKTIPRIAVIGPLADSRVDQMGSWAMDGRPSDVQTPLANLRAKFGMDRVLYSGGLKNSRDTSRAGFPDAVRNAAASDVVLLFLGEEQILSGEAHSRAFLDLPGAQEALAEEIAKTGKPVIGIIMAGRPLTFHSAAGRMKSILYAWHPGTMGGSAIGDLLFGDAVPSGKLPITFPRTVGQVPIYYAHLNTGRPASQTELGIPLGNPVNPVGYTSKYVDVDFTPEYPFGFGLSYTHFKYSGTSLSATRLKKGGTLIAFADVSNRGSVDADEVVQFYTRQVSARISRPVRELKAFRRIHLKAGESARLSFPLTHDELAFYDEKMQSVVESGKIQAWIAPDSASGAPAEFMVE